MTVPELILNAVLKLWWGSVAALLIGLLLGLAFLIWSTWWGSFWP